MTSIAQAIHRLKQRLPEFLAPSLIRALCEKCQHEFRTRTLTPVLVVQLLVLRILQCNTAYRRLPHLAQVNFTASAFCQALGKLPLELLQMLLARLRRMVTEERPFLPSRGIFVFVSYGC